MPTSSVPEGIPDGIDALLSKHLFETEDTLALYLLQSLEVLRSVFHRLVIPTTNSKPPAWRFGVASTLRPTTALNP